MRHQAALTIPITMDRHSGQPLHEQIAAQVGAAVERGLLARRARLPSTRTLAAVLGVSRGVVTTAYELLFTRGYLESRAGSGTYVAGRRPAASGTLPLQPAPPGSPSRGRARPAPAGGQGARGGFPGPVLDLRPGQVDTEACPLAAWRSAWRRASFNRPPAQPLPALGLPELRRAIAGHISYARGVPVDPGNVVVTGGTASGLRILLAALGLGARQVAVEEPVPPAVHRAVAAGAEAVPAVLAVDAGGARLDAVPGRCRAIVVSADAHLPLGHVLSGERRRAALAWESSTGGHVIEIACDAVFRPAASRLPRLYGAAGTRSILVGGFCGLLTPALNLGYAIVPRDLVEALGRRFGEHGGQPPYPTQLALAALLRDGVIVQLMHRLGHRYAARHRIVESALAPLRRVRLGASHPVDTEVLYLPDRVDARQLAGRAIAHGVRVTTLDPYHFSGRAVPPALVIGFGHQPDQGLRRALSRLVDALCDRP